MSDIPVYNEPKTEPGIVAILIVGAIVVALLGFGIRLAWLNFTPCSWHDVKGAPIRCLNEGNNMSEARFTLKTYTGVGSGVFKHGTIVQIVDGKPVVVGSFHDETGKFSPGTVIIEEAK